VSCCWLIYGGCRWWRWCSCNNNFFYNKTQQHHFWNLILMTRCKLCSVYARSGAGGSGGSKRGRRWGRWADGADVVFTDTARSLVGRWVKKSKFTKSNKIYEIQCPYKSNSTICNKIHLYEEKII